MAIASTILMVRPKAFSFNVETAENNFFQSVPELSSNEIQKKALEEFDNAIAILRGKEIDVLVIEDTSDPPKPSAIFPNNWLNTSPEGIVSVFPMYASNRRPEKRDDILHGLAERFVVKDVQDWSEFEVEGKFLEGTGSMVIDHDSKIIYACYSPRTDISLLEKFANVHGYRAIIFLATDKKGNVVYHTNVMMSIGEGFAVICEEAIEEEWELIAVRQLLETRDHEIISISKEQMHAFAGNMLQVRNSKDEKFLVLSQTAFDSLTDTQKEKLSFYSELLPVAVPTIEKAEGGSIRCMMVEVFLTKKEMVANGMPGKSNGVHYDRS